MLNQLRFLLQNAFSVGEGRNPQDSETPIFPNRPPSEEEELIAQLLSSLDVTKGICVDIGASDGLTISNTFALFQKGWPGLAVECHPPVFKMLASNYTGFANVNLVRSRVTPVNVSNLLHSNEIPVDFDFLSLDIDGYDYFVLEQILTHFRPRLICAEINEKIPPPIKFTVHWDKDYRWNEDHFYGQSISQLADLAAKNDYVVANLLYGNAFLVAREVYRGTELTAEEAYEHGYKNKPNRQEKFPWNRDMEAALSLPPREALEFINTTFAKYHGKYTATL